MSRQPFFRHQPGQRAERLAVAEKPGFLDDDGFNQLAQLPDEVSKSWP